MDIETTLDAVLEEVEKNPDAIEQYLDRMSQEQPSLLAYLFSEEHGNLSDIENDLVLATAAIIYETLTQLGIKPDRLSGADISEIEDIVLDILNKQFSKPIDDRLEVFYPVGFQWAPLLELVEDAFFDQEDFDAPPESRVLMFAIDATFLYAMTGSMPPS